MPDSMTPSTQPAAVALESALPPEPWLIVHTATRGEKIVARRLREKGIIHYLPLQRVTRHYASQPCEVELAVLPGFVFARGSIENVRAACPASSVRGIHPVENQREFEGQMHRLEQMLLHKKPQLPAAAPDIPRLDRAGGKIKGIDGLLAILDQACGLGLGVAPRVLDA